jgi:glycosyltransferase involved in cell wall biosynthesis
MMISGKSVVVVMPAYKAGQTLRKTYAEIPFDIVDKVLLVDDASDDTTVEVARQLGIELFIHDRNLGYGANQKTCYREALKQGAEIVVMLHPDYQYDPRLVSAMAAMIASGVYDVVLGSRIIGGSPKKGGMPTYKFIANRLLTLFQNLLMGSKLSEFHTGYRGFSRKVLETLPLLANSDDFVFDNQMLAQAIAKGFQIGEISCPTRYFPEASSVNFSRSVVYGLGVVRTCIQYRLWKWGLIKSQIFSESGTYRISAEYYKGLERTGKKA